MTPARLAALEALAEAARKWRDVDISKFNAPHVASADLERAVDALDALPHSPPQPADTRRVRVAVYQHRDHPEWLSAAILPDEDGDPALWPQLAILTADIPLTPPPVPEIAATVEEPT